MAARMSSKSIHVIITGSIAVVVSWLYVYEMLSGVVAVVVVYCCLLYTSDAADE